MCKLTINRDEREDGSKFVDMLLPLVNGRVGGALKTGRERRARGEFPWGG